jgi:hypothetical protein
MKVTAFWDTALCRFVEVDPRFRGAYCIIRKVHIYIHTYIYIHLSLGYKGVTSTKNYFSLITLLRKRKAFPETEFGLLVTNQSFD